MLKMCFAIVDPKQVGASNIDRPRELSSFQSFSSNPILPSIEKTCGQKRPWYSLKESLSKQLCSKSLDLNVPAGENNAGNEGCTPNVVQSPESPRGANYTTGIFRFVWNWWNYSGRLCSGEC
jgi:hypothetical protein